MKEDPVDLIHRVCGIDTSSLTINDSILYLQMPKETFCGVYMGVDAEKPEDNRVGHLLISDDKGHQRNIEGYLSNCGRCYSSGKPPHSIYALVLEDISCKLVGSLSEELSKRKEQRAYERLISRHLDSRISFWNLLFKR